MKGSSIEQTSIYVERHYASYRLCPVSGIQVSRGNGNKWRSAVTTASLPHPGRQHSSPVFLPQPH